MRKKEELKIVFAYGVLSSLAWDIVSLVIFLKYWFQIDLLAGWSGLATSKRRIVLKISKKTIKKNLA